MSVKKLLISSVKIRIFCPKKSKFGPKMAFLFILGQALLVHLVGGCGARAVSRKTPIYFMYYYFFLTWETCTKLFLDGVCIKSHIVLVKTLKIVLPCLLFGIVCHCLDS